MLIYLGIKDQFILWFHCGRWWNGGDFESGLLYEAANRCDCWTCASLNMLYVESNIGPKMLCNNQLRNIFWSNLSYQAVKSVSNEVSFHLHCHWHQNCKIVIQGLNLDTVGPNHDLTRAHSNYSRCYNSDDSNNCHLFGSLDLATLNWLLVEFGKVQSDSVVEWNDCQVPKQKIITPSFLG